jgi:mannosylglycoprotein endo-beta-mannosidase
LLTNGNQKLREPLLWKNGGIELGPFSNSLEDGLKIQVAKIKRKKILVSMIDDLDKKEETNALSNQELDLKHYLNERLVHLLREEEIKWYQRAKTKDLLEGDDNTQYFHLVANGKYRKQHIFKLEQEDGVIVGDVDLKIYITNYYK